MQRRPPLSKLNPVIKNDEKVRHEGFSELLISLFSINLGLDEGLGLVDCLFEIRMMSHINHTRPMFLNIERFFELINEK